MNSKDFLQFSNWVVAGDVLNKEKYASKIYEALERAGKMVVGINPNYKAENISSQGKKVYKSLREVPYNIDVINLCVNPKTGMDIIREAMDLHIANVLIQPGAESKEILETCRDYDIVAIEGCALVDISSDEKLKYFQQTI
jgi:uncharacterized protein